MGTYRAVKLIRNRVYPTYQLHAVMANKKTTPQEGLRLAALITLQWLQLRLEGNVPREIACVPEPGAYRSVTDDVLTSFHIHSGFVLDVVSLPEQGLWSLQITEPDLGSDPGNPEQSRKPIPGRIIETNVAYKVVGGQLECGFQTLISDPEGTAEEAEVYRLAIIRQLIDHPDFGLGHLSRLTQQVTRISTVEQLKNLHTILRSDANQMPCVIFTQTEGTQAPPLPDISAMVPGRPGLPGLPPIAPPPLQIPSGAKGKGAEDPPYDMERFARSCVTYCRTYLLEDGVLERFKTLTKLQVEPGDIAVFEPVVFGGNTWTIPFKPNKTRQDEGVERLRQTIYGYSKHRAYSFGSISFLSAAREDLISKTRQALGRSEETNAQWLERFEGAKLEWEQALLKKDDEIAGLNEQLDRQRQYQTRLDREKAQLREQCQQEIERYRTMLEAKEEDIAYLKRKLSRPQEHDRIAPWTEEYFSDRLWLHPKAIALLQDKSARAVSCDLICDALDFLATDYWARRYRRISTDEMNSRCSHKYGRPFEVTPTGTTTIEFTPNQYKVKYFLGAMGKPVESPLDYHLGVGSDPENLLRIYFLHDDEKQLIVVGSLPRHLRAVTIK